MLKAPSISVLSVGPEYNINDLKLESTLTITLFLFPSFGRICNACSNLH